jgi:hypothetical protein
MAAPIEMHKGNERQTVYSDSKANALVKKGWSFVADLTPYQRAQLEQGRLPMPRLRGVEKQLEAETGHNVKQTSAEPPTFVETDEPAP